MKLFIGAISLALCIMTNAEEAKSQITISDLGLLPGGTASSALAINNHSIIVGLANDSSFALHRPLWDANTGAIIGFADNMNPASTAVPEHINDAGEMAGTEMYGDNVYQGVYWNPTGQAFALPPMAGVDPFYGSLHTRAHGINNLGQLVGTGKEGAPNFYTHAVLWPDNDTEALDLGFLGQGTPLNYSEAYGLNDSSHVVGNSAVGTLIRAFLWRDGQMIDLGALSGQIVSEAYAINNTGVIVGRSNFYPVMWEYDVSNPSSTPTIQQLPIPSGFFSATPTAVNDSGDVVGYAGSPHIDAHAILWRNGIAIDLGVWPGGHYSVANGINNRGQIVGTGTVAGDNLDHALMWTQVAEPCDFNADLACDVEDLNALLAEGPIASGVIVTPGVNHRFDLTGDGVIDNADVDQWLAGGATFNGLGSPYKRGDANLDGVVDGLDFVLWNANKFNSTLLWDNGNFDGNGLTDGSDFVIWNSHKFTASDGSAVPEPGLLVFLVPAMIVLGTRRSQRRG